MHTGIDAVVDPSTTDALISELIAIDGVAALTVHRGQSVKPPGDRLSLTATNRSTDRVLSSLHRHTGNGTLSITMTTTSAAYGKDSSSQLLGDVDEVSAETAETAMRRHTRRTANFIAANICAGLIAIAAVLSDSSTTAITALVAAGIIATVFEPVARSAIAVVQRRADLLLTAEMSFAIAYLLVIVVPLLATLIVRGADHSAVAGFKTDPVVSSIVHAGAMSALISAAGALAGAYAVASGRFTQLAGPVVALQILPSAATLGAAIALGDANIARDAVQRLALSLVFVGFACLVVFAYKHVVVHQRRAALR